MNIVAGAWEQRMKLLPGRFATTIALFDNPELLQDPDSPKLLTDERRGVEIVPGGERVNNVFGSGTWRKAFTHATSTRFGSGMKKLIFSRLTTGAMPAALMISPTKH